MLAFTCPNCVHARIHPSRWGGWADLPLRLLLLRPWRCLRCYRRMWRPCWMAPVVPVRL
jgi:hypothetical protein